MVEETQSVGQIGMTKLLKNGEVVFEGTKKQAFDFFKKEVVDKRYLDLYWATKHFEYFRINENIWKFERTKDK